MSVHQLSGPESQLTYQLTVSARPFASAGMQPSNVVQLYWWCNRCDPTTQMARCRDTTGATGGCIFNGGTALQLHCLLRSTVPQLEGPKEYFHTPQFSTGNRSQRPDVRTPLSQRRSKGTNEHVIYGAS